MKVVSDRLAGDGTTVTGFEAMAVGAKVASVSAPVPTVTVR